MAKFEHSVKIDAPVEVVWSVLRNSSMWPQWFDAVDNVTMLGAIEESTTFQWRDGERAGTGLLTVIEANQVLGFEMQEEDKRSEHEIRLRKAGGLFGGGDTKLDYVMEYDVPGGVIGSFAVTGNPVDEGKVKRVAERIKELAEQQAKRR